MKALVLNCRGCGVTRSVRVRESAWALNVSATLRGLTDRQRSTLVQFFGHHRGHGLVGAIQALGPGGGVHSSKPWGMGELERLNASAGEQLELKAPRDPAEVLLAKVRELGPPSDPDLAVLVKQRRAR